jgi:probable rRNA maturation factor
MALPDLRLSLQFGDIPHVARHRAALPRHKVIRAIRHALDADAEMTVRIVGEDEGRELNQSYRGKDYATNVLTFDYATEPMVMADLVLCAPVVAREAKEQGKTLIEYVDREVVKNIPQQCERLPEDLVEVHNRAAAINRVIEDAKKKDSK